MAKKAAKDGIKLTPLGDRLVLKRAEAEKRPLAALCCPILPPISHSEAKSSPSAKGMSRTTVTVSPSLLKWATR